MNTLPELSCRWNVGLDALRALVRRDPELSKLGVRVGPTRAFDEAEAERIRAAFLARNQRPTRTVVAA